MNNESILLLSSHDRSQSYQRSVAVSYPSSQQMHNYQQLAHELRSKAVRSLIRKMVNNVKSLWVRFESSQAQRKVVAELDQLDTYMLKDIGLTRSDVEQLRYGSISVDALNNRRASSIADRQKINKLQVCQCNEKLGRELTPEALNLAQCA